MIAFIIFYVVIIFNNFYPFTLKWEENKKLLSYNKDVLIYEWKHQNKEETLFYNQRYDIFYNSLFKTDMTQDKINQYYYNEEIVQKRNHDRERDLEILKIGLKLYKKKNRDYPIAINPDKIERGTEIHKKLKEVLYNIPTDPDPSTMLSKRAYYYYQSLDGYFYTITIDFEYFNEYGKVNHDIKTFNNNL